MIEVSNADRVVFPEVNRTKGDVVAYYAKVAERALPHLLGRPLSIRRYPKGLAGPGFFQKNVPDHYPASIEHFAVPRSREATKKHKGKTKERDETVYPIVREAEHLPYLANQGAIELHVPTARAPEIFRPDRLIIDLDPPPGALPLVRKAARIVREALSRRGVETVPIATGSKGYHLVAAIEPNVDGDALGHALHQFSALMVAAHPEELTIVFRIANRGARVFVDFLRNHPLATVVAPYSLRAKPKATVATPLSWDEIDSVAPDGFTMADVDRLLDREDSLASLAKRPIDARAFVSSVGEEFAQSGLALEPFDRFRS